MSTILPVQFQGVDEGSDPKAQPPGTLLVADNVRMQKPRVLSNRRGTSARTRALLGGGTLSKGVRFLPRNGELALFDGEFVDTFSPDLNKFQKIGRPTCLRGTHRGLVDSTRSASGVDIALYGDLLLTAFVAGPVGGPLYLQIENVETGAKVLPPLLLAEGGAWPRIAIHGTWAFIASSILSGAVDCTIFDLETMTIVSQSLIEGSGGGVPNGPVDISIYGDTLYAVYPRASGTDRLRVQSFDHTANSFLPITSVTFGTTSVTPTSVSIVAAEEAVHVLHVAFASSTTSLRSLDPTSLAVTVGPTTAPAVLSGANKYASVRMLDVDNLLISIVGSDAASSVPFRLETHIRDASDHSLYAQTQRVTPHIVAIGQPFQLDERWYVLGTLCPKDNSLITNTAIPNASCVLLEIEIADSITSIQDSPHNHVGTAENLTGWFPTSVGHMPQVAVAGSKAYVAAAYRNREPLNFMSIPIGFNLHTFEVGAGDIHRAASLGGGCLVAGAAPYWCDGASAMPYGFAAAPMILNVSGGGAGGVMVAGDYSYVAVYEWRDANGVLHRSIASPPRGLTITAGQKVTVKVSTIGVSQHQGPPYGTGNVACANPVSIALYRTEVGGSVYHRLTLEPSFNVLFNDPTASSVDLLDNSADADIGSGSPARPLSVQPLLYTAETGELADVPPPSLITVATHNNRLVGIDGSQRVVWFTKEQIDDTTIAPGFNEVLTITFANEKTALASLSSALIVFGPDSIDLVEGRGPDATGAGGWDVSRVQTDIGCVNPKSVVTTPMGVMFQSPRGLELISSGKDFQWVGKQVENTLADYPVITSAVLCAADHEVRFTCNKADGSAGLVLAWDYLNKFWFRRFYFDSYITSNPSVPFVDAALIDGVYTLLTVGGQIFYETDASFLDAGDVWVTPDIQLAWMSPWSPGGRGRFQHVVVLGTSKSAHGLEVSTATDYRDWETPRVFSEDTLGTTVGASKVKHPFTVQKAQAGRVRIRVLPPTVATYGTGEGAVFEGLALSIQQYGGTVKTSAEEQG